MKRQACQAKNGAKSWDDAISFAKAKIAELRDAVRTFENCRKRGETWPGLFDKSATHN
jgi:hypothetical protein